MISIGTGGIYGKGFNHLELNVPVRESDMIFTVIAEDFGLVGGGLVLLTYLFLIYRMLRVTFKSNNRFYTFISTGFIMMNAWRILRNGLTHFLSGLINLIFSLDLVKVSWSLIVVRFVTRLLILNAS